MVLDHFLILTEATYFLINIKMKLCTYLYKNNNKKACIIKKEKEKICIN